MNRRMLGAAVRGLVAHAARSTANGHPAFLPTNGIDDDEPRDSGCAGGDENADASSPFRSAFSQHLA